MKAPPRSDVLEKKLARFRGELTVADAAARSGLPLRDAEAGLRYLAGRYSGHLRATEKGEILYSFPKGLILPPEKRVWRRALNAMGRFALGLGRFMVRAWVSVVLVGYAVIFAILLIALSGKDGEKRGGGEIIGILLRIFAEALYWTFHPFSPVYLGREPPWMQNQGRRRHADAPSVPFYEKVNRFVFGPPAPKRDVLEEERKMLAEIRRQRGRVSPADVMRILGLSREEAERMLLRLVVDYDGDLDVHESGAIYYRFPNLRVTARAGKPNESPTPIWSQEVIPRPLTGNSGGMNFLFIAINAFNLGSSSWAWANDLTLDRVGEIIARMGQADPLPLPPVDGTPMVLGAIPFFFSLALFAIPLIRTMRQPAAKRQVVKENGWRALLRAVLSSREKPLELVPGQLSKAWESMTGITPSERDLESAVQKLGGEVHLRDDGQIVYRFTVLEQERNVTALERDRASLEEAKPGNVVFSSDEEM